MVQVDADLSDAVALEELKGVFQQRLAPDGQHRFKSLKGQGSQPRSFAGS